MTRGIFVSQPGIEREPPALEAQSHNHWTSRDIPLTYIYFKKCFIFILDSLTSNTCQYVQWIKMSSAVICTTSEEILRKWEH